jgi:hypothetical protein
LWVTKFPFFFFFLFLTFLNSKLKWSWFNYSVWIIFLTRSFCRQRKDHQFFVFVCFFFEYCYKSICWRKTLNLVESTKILIKLKIQFWEVIFPLYHYKIFSSFFLLPLPYEASFHLMICEILVQIYRISVYAC